MKKQSPVGLVVEGNSTKSVILRLPRLAEDIGPIKSTATRVARRLSNFLRAGYAVAEYSELIESHLILIRVPDAALERVVEDLCSAELEFESLSVVLCESWVSSQALDPLRKKGAATATIMPVPSSRRRWFIVEGESQPARQLKRLIEKNDGKTLELRSGRKECYFAAELLATALPIPLYAAAQQALRSTGLSGKHLQYLLEEMAEKMFRDFLHASRIKWGGPISDCSTQVSDSHFRLLQSTDPALAELVVVALEFAREKLPPGVRQA
ncbi:MAG: hypothetical protein JWP08_1099 [Bryobacterales bacterium]|nr:hypothetical protein [Bryobacterales bacterium]